MDINTLSINNLSIGYKKGRKVDIILSDINLLAKPGDLIALIGRNGTGKSTLLRTIVNLQSKLTGKISFNNKSFDDYSNSEVSRIVSYVSTSRVIIQNITSFDLVGLGRSVYTNIFGSLTKNDNNIINEALKLVGADNIKHRLVSELSDGERQKIMIARAIAQNTPVIILDEPTAFLDLPNKYEVIKLLKKITHEKNKIIIFSTHDLSIAFNQINNTWFINENKIVSGTINELTENKMLDSLFAGTGIKLM